MTLKAQNPEDIRHNLFETYEATFENVELQNAFKFLNRMKSSLKVLHTEGVIKGWSMSEHPWQAARAGLALLGRNG